MGILGRGRLPAIGGNIARDTDNPAHAFAIAIERPLVAVGVEDVGNSREALELIAVVASKTGGRCADARGFEFDISGEQLVEMNGVIRAAEMVGQGCFARADDVPAKRTGCIGHEGLERTAHLVF